MRWIVLALGAVAVVAACGSEPPVEPELDPVIYEIGGFRIEDTTREAPRSLIDSIAAALGSTVAAVTAFLPEFSAPTDTITFRLLDGSGVPFVNVGNLVISQWERDIALEYLPHQVAHLFTGYTRRAFLEEGLAVYVTEALDPTSTITNPYRGQPPHAWVSLFELNGSTIPLATAFGAANLGYSYIGSSADASAWQVFIEGASFTRWVIATYGRDAWFNVYDANSLAPLATPVLDLERAWLAVATNSYPTPLSCEDALSTRGGVGTREQFWCARARGE